MQWLKGRRAHHLLAEFPHLKKQFWGRRLWARGHFCRSSGNVTDEVIAKYIADQNVNQDEDFKVDGGVHLLPEARLVRETFCRPLAGTGHLTIASIGDDANKIDYEIYFRVSRSSKPRVVNLYVQSACSRDEHHRANKNNTAKLTEIPFAVILFKAPNN